MLCEYGCGREAIHQFGNGRWCCSNDFNKCLKVIETKRKVAKETWSNPEYKENRINKTVRTYWDNVEYRNSVVSGVKRSWSNPDSGLNSKVRIDKLRKSNEQAYINNLGLKNVISITTKKAMEKEEIRDKIRRSWNEERKENLRQEMQDWRAIWMQTKVVNSSKPQKKIFKLFCQVCPYPIHNFPIYRGKGKRSFNVDMADPKLGIVVEYDGHRYHKGEFGDIKKDLERQKEIEEDGWKVLRYQGSEKKDIIPTLEQLKQDINKLVEVE